MTVATEPSKRFKITEGSQIDVRIHNPLGAENGAECERLDHTEAQIVEISNQSVRICSQHSFPFYKKLVIEFVALEEGDKPLLAEVEVLGARPHPFQKDLWANECVFTDQELEGEVEILINEMAKKGCLDRRESQRESRDETVNSRMEASPDYCEVAITDLSSEGVGLFSRVPIEPGRKVQLEVTEEQEVAEGEPNRLTVRALRQTSVTGGYLVGCRVIKGSMKRKPDQVIPAKIRPNIEKTDFFRYASIGCMLLLIVFVARGFLNLF